MSFGTDPFTPNNELRYRTFQAQDNFTKFGARHSLTVGGSAEKYHSDNVFYAGSNSVYVYNTLADFYTDTNDYLANPKRTTSPVNLRRFQVQYNNLPGSTSRSSRWKLDYVGGYVQDQWHARSNFTSPPGFRWTHRFSRTPPSTTRMSTR